MNNFNFKKLNHFIYWVVAGLCIYILSFGFNDTDLYYIIPTGKYLMKNFTNETVFPNIFTPISTIKDTMIIQNWLYCIIVAFIDSHLHTFGLWLLQTIFIIVSLLCILKFLNFRKSKHKILCTYIALGIMFVFTYVNLRPQMLTFILIMAEILILENYRKTNNSKILWLMLLPIWIEINCHASYWIMHFIVLLPYIVPIPKKIQQKLKLNIINNNLKSSQLKKLILPCLGMFGIIFLNPYKTESVLYVFKALTNKALEIISITELTPFNILDIHSIVIIFTIILFIIAIQKGKVKSVTFWMFLGFLVLIFRQPKWMPFYTLGLLYLLRDIFTAYCNRKSVFPKTSDYGYSKLSKVLLVGLLLFLILVGISFTVENYNKGVFSISNSDYMRYDKTAVMVTQDIIDIGEYLDKQDEPAYIYTYFELGNYFEYLGYEVNMDARPELYMDTNINTYKQTSLKEKVTEAPLPQIVKVLKGIDFAKCEDALKPQKGEAIDVSKYVLSYDEYSKMIDNIDTDYFITTPDSMLLKHYLESNPDKYEYIIGKEYSCYKKL